MSLRRSSSCRVGSPSSPLRRGMTMIEATVSIVIVVVVVIIALPWLVELRERSRRLACEANLFRIGQAIANYRTGNPLNAYPAGATYLDRDRAAGTSWWLEIMPFVDLPEVARKWQPIPHSGDFSQDVENPNLELADGLRQSIFLCPSSPLPPTNRPRTHYSEANQKKLADRGARGVTVPTYAAVLGGAPDAKDIDIAKFLSQPHGRNTSDGKYGILSASGAMPVNQRIAEAAVRDPQGKTLLIVEQSNFVRDAALDPPDQYDPRSAWSKGMFMGSSGDYHNPSPTASGVDGDGSARVWNVTTIRYAINDPQVFAKPGGAAPGYVFDPAPPRAAAPDQPAPEPPPYPPEGYGPGHNHGINSAHPGGAHVLMADGSARFFNEALDLTILLMFATRDDGRDVDDF